MKDYIILYPDKILKRVADKVIDFDDPDLQKNINTMIEIMYEHDGVGLAANQVGLKEAIIVYDLSDKKDDIQVLINPYIMEQSNIKYKMVEGCLSFPGIFFPIIRPEKVWIEGYNRYGDKVTFEASERKSSILQHEIDHLQGISFIDRLSKVQKKVYLTKLKKFRKKLKRVQKKYGHRKPK